MAKKNDMAAPANEEKFKLQNSSVILGNTPNADANKRREYRYGWGRFTPNWLQCFNKAPFLLFCLTLLLTVQMTVIIGILPASVSHIERRFHFTSAEVGGFVCMYDIGYMLTLFPICHYGSRGHKGRWIGASALLTALAAFICILPHFVAEDYEYGREEVEMYCTSENANVTSTDCDRLTKKGKGMKSFFFIAQFLFGVASAPMANVAVAYLDENVSQRASSTYISIYSASNLFGPCIGYTAASLLSRHYGYITVDTSTLPMGNNYDDPRWYGAWWIGVLGFGLISAFLALPIFGFGRELPGKAELRAKDVDEAHRGTASLQLSLSHTDWTSLKQQLKALALNPTYISLIFEQCCTIFIVGGLATFATKYLETLFSLSASSASAAAAVTGIPPAVVGIVIGTVLQRCMNLKCRGNILLGIVGTVMGTVCWLVFFITCPTKHFAGVTHVSDDSSYIGSDLIESCNRNCSCKMSRFEPYCWTAQNITFFSKCHAGCNDQNATNCTCTGIGPNNMVKGPCASQCKEADYMPFLLGFAVMVLFSSLKKNPVEQATLRCVPFSMRTFALALGGIPKKLFGSIPATPTIGAIMNANCVVWQEKCGHKEVCMLYDNEKLASDVQFSGVIGFALASTALFVALMRYRPPSPEERSPRKLSDEHSLVEEVLRSSWKEAVVEP